MEMGKSNRKTLMTIPTMPKPYEIYQDLIASPGWPYKTNREQYLKRDRALAALLYIGELRVSEALRLIKKQFIQQEDQVLVQSILLSKRKPGKVAYREARLPLQGERAKFTELVRLYLDTLESDDRLFPWSLKEEKRACGKYLTKDGELKVRYSVRLVGTRRAWGIVNTLLPDYTEHWLRAFGDQYLYDQRGHDLLAVAHETKQDARTVEKYLGRDRHKQYPVR